MAGAFYSENYTIVSLLGQGANGNVFIGFDNKLGREVAIKELVKDESNPDKERVLNRFLREAKITGRLEHPGIVPVYELNTKPDGTVYYVMRHVKGRTFHQAINDCKGATPEETFRDRLHLLDNLIILCEAIGYAHSKGVVHRDLKLNNIIIGEFGETIILDWGIAKVLNSGEDEETGKAEGITADVGEDTLKTRQGAILGTPSYMAPEQVDRSFGEIDPRTDVYALGVILFILLTGRRPYRITDANALLKEIVSQNPSPSPKDNFDFVPPELSSICEKAMAKDKNKRFADASEMAAELRAFRDGRLVSVYAYSKMELLKRFVSKNKAAIFAVSAVLIALVVGAGFAIKFGIIAQKAKIQAESALVDVTGLSESSAKLAEELAKNVTKYFAGDPAELKKINAANAWDKIPVALDFDPIASIYQVWLMKDDGQIIYDEDPKQIGKYLFTDEMYAKFPELHQFGQKVLKAEWGIGYYSFLGAGSEKDIVYKIAAWDSAKLPDGKVWKVVITYPYSQK